MAWIYPQSELEQAPTGSYDETTVGDVATVRLKHRYDLVFSCAVMEHMRDAPLAFANLSGALEPGGIVAHFVPDGLAPFAVAIHRRPEARCARALKTPGFRLQS